MIHLLRGRPERLHPAAAAGNAPVDDSYVITPGEGLAGLALANGVLVNVSDVPHDPRASRFAKEVGVSSMLVAPIQSRSRIIGTVSCVSREPRTFSEEDERLLTICLLYTSRCV